jgi:uncharacterized protein with ATP-grasp and redox domains
MKIHTECVPCLLKRIIFETKISTKEKEIRTKTIKNTCKMLSELYDPNECSATIATKVHKLAYETLGDKDPYKDLKDKSNEIAKSLIPEVENYLKCSDDPLRIAMLCSIIGNLMDFGIEGASENPENLSENFEEWFVEDLGHDDSEELINLLGNSKHVVFFTDNCGEIVFDKILLKLIKNFYPDIFLTVVVKGEPIISDATMDDAKKLKFEEVADEILTTGCFAIGLDFEKMPTELEKALDRADLIICKGMANFEAFSEKTYRPIAYLLRTKCNPIAGSIGLPVNINAIKLIK